MHGKHHDFLTKALDSKKSRVRYQIQLLQGSKRIAMDFKYLLANNIN